MGIPGEERITWTASLHHRQVGLLHIQSPRPLPPWGRTPMFTTGLPISRCLADIDDEVVPPSITFATEATPIPADGSAVRSLLDCGRASPNLTSGHMRGRRCHGQAWMGKGGDIAAMAPSSGLVATAAVSEREDGGGERVGGWWRQSIGRRDVRGGWGWGRDLDV